MEGVLGRPLEAGDGSSGGTPSITESALCDSILSTPDMVLDAPRFPTSPAPRRGSCDSGLAEDEDEQTDGGGGPEDSASTDQSSQSTETTVLEASLDDDVATLAPDVTSFPVTTIPTDDVTCTAIAQDDTVTIATAEEEPAV